MFILTGLVGTSWLGAARLSFVFMLLELVQVAVEGELKLPLPVGLLTLCVDSGDWEEDPVSLRTGLLRSMLDGGGFSRSVFNGLSSLFSLTLDLVDWPSNTIRGRFLSVAVLEL